jgi:uncharacterized protein GlcG (DUF336 family)
MADNSVMLLLKRASVSIALTIVAFAQTPPDPQNNVIPYGAPISTEAAKKAAAGAIAEARKNNGAMAVAIVDGAGYLVYFERMPGTQLGSVEIAIEKAKSAALFRRPTKVFQDAVAGGGAGLRMLGLTGAVPVEGGVPLVADGKVESGAMDHSGAFPLPVGTEEDRGSEDSLKRSDQTPVLRAALLHPEGIEHGSSTLEGNLRRLLADRLSRKKNGDEPVLSPWKAVAGMAGELRSEIAVSALVQKSARWRAADREAAEDERARRETEILA